MNDEIRNAASSALSSARSPQVSAQSALHTALPAAAFTASVLFDVLALVADSPGQAHSDSARAVDLLKVGLSASLAFLGLGLVEALKVPPAINGRDVTRALSLDGAVVAVYLLNLAARQKQLGSVTTGARTADLAGTGLSLVGLGLLAASGKLR